MVDARRRLLITALAFAALSMPALPAHAAKPRASSCGPVARRASTHLRIVGRQLQDTKGDVITPYGISTVGGPETIHYVLGEASTAAQIVAAHRYWHANTVRIQVSEDELFRHPTPGHRYDMGFAASVNRLVCLVLRQHQIAVINDNTRFTSNTPAPTYRTVRFWRFMAQRYASLPVIFDLFNEPRLTAQPATGQAFTTDGIWRLWQFGGSVAGVHYVGMQALVDRLRIDDHARTVVWVDAPWTGRRMRLLPDHLLRGTNLAYTFHKGSLTPGSAGLGAIADRAARGIPIVNGEWSQYASEIRPWECQPDAFSTVPAYLDLLHSLSIGMLAWSLQPGSLVRGRSGIDTVHDGNSTNFTRDERKLAAPSVMTPDYGCDAQSLGQGAGALVKDYFRRYGHTLRSALFPAFKRSS